MKTSIPLAFFLISILQTCYAPPVAQNKDKDKQNEENAEIGGLEDYMEYHRYLREVVNALESDPQFREKLEKADEQDIRSGKIAEQLEFVSHHVRSRLDEIKRVELSRLKELTQKKRRLEQNIDLEDPNHHHLDHANPHTFEIDDLKKLIAKTTADLVEADRKRREEFKEYELQKEYEKQYKLNHTNGDDREKLEQEYKQREEKHKKHDKLHEPGHKAQLEEVWQEQDQMQQEFDPKTFFMLHDIDSNGLWDQDEVKALFVKELEKMYAAGEPEDDMRERAEEMERMRESVFKEVDLNKDGFIDYEEFLAQTKRNDFQQDHGWQGLDENRPYTDQELEQYIRQHQMANQIPYGYQPPYPGHVPPPMYQQAPPGHHPNAPMHPNAMSGHHNGPIHPGAVPPQQFHPGQLPPQHPQQLQGQLNTNEIYPQHKQQQHPPQVHQQANFQQQQGGYQQHPQGNYQQQQQQGNYQQPQGVPQQVNYQQPQAVNQQPQGVPQQANYQQPQAVNQPPRAVPQQQVPVQQQQAPVQQQQQRQGAPVQGNNQQGAPVPPSNPNPNLHKADSPEINKV